MIRQLCRSWGSVRSNILANSSCTPKSSFPPSFLCRCESTSASMEASPAAASEAAPDAASEASPDTASAPFAPQKKLAAKMFYAPKYCNKEDIMRYFAGCNLNPDGVYVIYDGRFRPKYWVLEVEGEEALKKILSLSRKDLGGRRIILEKMTEPVKVASEDLNFTGSTVQVTNDMVERRPLHFCGRSLLVQNLPEDLSMHQLEDFFSGYLLSPKPMKIYRFIHNNVRTPLVRKLNGDLRQKLPQAAELRALVRFQTPLEARRAQREKQGQFCGAYPVDMRFVQ